MAKLENVGVTLRIGDAGYRLDWESGGARFHVWLDADAKPRDQIIYKNPPPGTPYRGEGYFETRKLDAEAKVNKPIFAEAMRIAMEQDLFNKALAADAAWRAKEEAERAEVVRIHRIKQAGVELYEALKALRDCESGEETEKALAQADAAIRKAEGL